ncbi:response regulator [Patescibacteria group bacterium]|nr:response regulator [Patescibacteria group bacterium]
MKRILFVEDDPDQIFMYNAKFELEGLLLMVADNERDALKFARIENPDLILLDLLLRHENGLDILEKMKQDEKISKIPVLVFTNYDTKEYRERAAKLGAQEYIIKAQTTPSEIVKKIKKIVGA